MSTLRILPTTFIGGSRRLCGYRAALRHGMGTVWRCDCGLPHRSEAAALACGIGTLKRRDSGFYAGGIDMEDWQRVPVTDDERREIVAKIQSLPASIDGALDNLEVFRTRIMAAQSYEEIRFHQGAAESIKLMWRANQTVREHFDFTFLAGEWRVGQELVKEDAGLDPRGRPEKSSKLEPLLADKVGNRTYGWRLKQIATLPVEALDDKIRELHQRAKEASLSGVIKLLRADESAMRRMDSLTTPPLEDAFDLRIGDCREMLDDIAPDSIPLIMTDPPYETSAEPLWRWLGDFAMRVLEPGGSLICYFGAMQVNKLYRVFDDAGLRHWVQCWMKHDASQRVGGRFFIADGKPILWYVKGYRRGRILIPNMVSDSVADKTSHNWAQGDAGVRLWVHQLTEPGETIVDPFAGTAEWGRITCLAGRRWIGCDIKLGGTTTVEAEEEE